MCQEYTNWSNTLTRRLHVDGLFELVMEFKNVTADVLEIAPELW